MPSATVHDKIGDICAVGIAALSLPFIPLQDAIALGIVISLSTKYLSPDLDLASKSYYRWKWLRFYWLPYQKIAKHRSFLSHSAFISGSIRFVYAFWWLLPIMPEYYIFIVWLGVCLADLIHCIADWSPL